MDALSTLTPTLAASNANATPLQQVAKLAVKLLILAAFVAPFAAWYFFGGSVIIKSAATVSGALAVNIAAETGVARFYSIPRTRRLVRQDVRELVGSEVQPRLDRTRTILENRMDSVRTDMGTWTAADLDAIADRVIAKLPPVVAPDFSKLEESLMQRIADAFDTLPDPMAAAPTTQSAAQVMAEASVASREATAAKQEQVEAAIMANMGEAAGAIAIPLMKERMRESWKLLVKQGPSAVPGFLKQAESWGLGKLLTDGEHGAAAVAGMTGRAARIDARAI